MEIKINNNILVLDDTKRLHDVGLEYNLDLSDADIKTLLETDSELVYEASKWGCSDTVVSDGFMSTISRYVIGKEFPCPCDLETHQKFCKEVEDKAESKGLKLKSKSA